MSDRIVGWIRTAVPVGVGAVCAWAAKRLGLHLDSAGLEAGATAGATAAYYFVASTLERRWPAFGVLLGVPKAPSYRSSTAPPLETGDERPAPLGIEQLKELLPPGTQIYVPPTPAQTPRTFTMTVDASGAHLEEAVDAIAKETS